MREPREGWRTVGWFVTTEGVALENHEPRCQTTLGRVELGSRFGSAKCDCGASAHNAIIDEVTK